MKLFEPVTLQHHNLVLRPITWSDCQVLWELAQDNSAELFAMYGPQQLNWYQQAVTEQKQGNTVAFCIEWQGKLIGTTRFGDFNRIVPAAEIGWTWLDKSVHGKGINKQMKYLMLNHAFTEWQLARVQIKAAAQNIRSQRAIEKLGAVKEGVLRNHRRLANGQLDDTIMYSITPNDWPAIKLSLET